MQSATARFLRYLRVERNASELTIKSYREDLVALMQGGYTGPDVYGVVDGTFPADVVIENGVIVQIGQVYLP